MTYKTLLREFVLYIIPYGPYNGNYKMTWNEVLIVILPDSEHPMSDILQFFNDVICTASILNAVVLYNVCSSSFPTQMLIKII